MITPEKAIPQDPQHLRIRAAPDSRLNLQSRRRRHRIPESGRRIAPNLAPEDKSGDEMVGTLRGLPR
ncbi:MAG: hypothetical protein ISS31_02300 [Kiritimatiellae bacterium]|nr:hypothetical protein [Kiritimatiellia bacterium]